MGIVGFIRILEDAGLKKELDICDNYIEFDSKLLEKFDEYYFDYFLKRYDISKREIKKVDRYLGIARKEEKFKDAVNWIKSVIDTNRKKVKGKFEDKKFEYEFNGLFKEIKKVKKYDQIEKLEELVDRFKKLITIYEVNEKLTLNYIRNILSTQFFGQASFLQKICARKSLEEQREIMHKDYIKPILEEVRLYKELNMSETVDDLLQFIDTELNKDCSKTYPKLLRNIKKLLKKKKVLDNLKKIPHCSIWEEYLATSDFTEAVFVPLAVSNNNAKNFMWQGNTSYPICSLVKFILFCTPAGVTDMKDGYLGFVNMDTSVEELYRHNENLLLMQDEENPFESLIYDILSETRKKSIWTLQNILFIELNANYDTKNCKLNYFNINKNTARYFKSYTKNNLMKIRDTRFKGELVSWILNNKDIKYLIHDKLIETIKSGKSSYDSYLATKARFTLKKVLKGCEKVDSNRLWVIYKEGERLNTYFKENESENKIQGIAYRLLNASKARNKKEFMDSLLRIYMAAGKEVPSLFLNVLHEKDLDFESIAHSFISGLISNFDNNEKEEK
ncbi:type I-B CRISPR-associated protein Cas8b1/Cst1 [Caldisalinibacter kiritimatiensis]|uniref:CRISPR-associated protein CXXC-CXXC domain-containing protein n=1 Tax=Caldisalinibacter kiritimatiensis TaxID=1304284 RepID=R1CHQ1_9FIRM|nr:type I-B CRISPR-associated protein Cas8b1/Cst1 [Caldisalinibacter kiritimatiensis]EOD01820.1 hypothetical protein L21TH_0092 [Caldisalinibacter kiritimatiensis]